MKKILKYSSFALALLIMFSSAALAQPDEVKKSIKSSLTKLFELSKAEKFGEAAAFIVYSGSEGARKYKDTYKFKVRKEAKQIKRICKKIKALLDITDNYVIGKFSKRTKNGLDINVLVVNFNSSGQKLSTKFEFIKVGDKFLLLSVK